MPQVQVLQDAPNALLAQLVEQRTLNPKVVGSIPSRRTNMHEWRNWNTRQTKDLVPVMGL